MRMRRTLAVTAAVLGLALVAQLGLTLVAQVGFSGRPHKQVSTRMVAIWRENPQSLKELEGLAEEVVIGKVVDIQHAEDLRPLDADELENDDVSIAVEVITIEVSKQLKGKSRGQKATIQLFHTGHSDLNLARKKAPPAGERPKKPEGGVKQADAPKFDRGEVQAAIPVTLHDDPAYRKGERYVLFVKKGPKIKVKGRAIETLAVVHPSGRYRVSKENNELEPVIEHGFAAKLKGKKVDELTEKLSQLRKEPP